MGLPLFQLKVTCDEDDLPVQKPVDPELSPGFLFLKELQDHIAQKTGVAPELSTKILQKKPVLQPVEATTTETSSTSDDQLYAGLRENVNLNDVIAKLGSRSNGHLSKLPSKCFKNVRVPILKEEEDFTDDPYPLIEEEEDRTYLQSKCFLQHFMATFFELTREIGMPEIASGARVGKARIMSRFEAIAGHDAKELWRDFVPTVDVPFWPDSGIEWYLRKRKKLVHKDTGTIYQWPPPDLIDGHTVQRIGSNLIPQGFLPALSSSGPGQKPKKEVVQEHNLEWQWEFVKMEHKLHERLTHPQLRFLLFIMLLFKTHLQDSTSLEPDCFR